MSAAPLVGLLIDNDELDSDTPDSRPGEGTTVVDSCDFLASREEDPIFARLNRSLSGILSGMPRSSSLVSAFESFLNSEINSREFSFFVDSDPDLDELNN